jgi:hypothetical protein
MSPSETAGPGLPLPTRPCPRCATEVPITQAIHPAALRAFRWEPCRSVTIVQYCGHGEELLPSPWGLLPVLEPEEL